MVIKQISFKHGWFYHYRVHNPKSEELLQDFSGLHKYLYDMFENCPHEHFEGGPRGSALKFNIPMLDKKQIVGHEVSSLTKIGLEVNEERYKSAHSKVQVFMLEKDNNTIAVEVPIWLHPEELEVYEKTFDSTEPLTGHIDVLRIEDGKVWVWDYKPKASKEKYACTQTFFYALMLSRRTGIPLEKFRCGYFDQFFAYIFEPKEELLLKDVQEPLIIK
ncbi:MAG: PD-(D/E)XK nuclease family protein [archaeon]